MGQKENSCMREVRLEVMSCLSLWSNLGKSGCVEMEWSESW